MKIKRNKRVEKSRQMRATVVTSENRGSHRSLKELKRQAYLSLRSNIKMSARKPKKVLALLEQDAAVQTERLQRLENMILTPIVSPQYVMVPLLVEPDEAVPEDTVVPQAAPVEDQQFDEPQAVQQPVDADQLRTNYQYMSAARRIRRRTMV